jgi:hypothetical protein
MSVATDTDVSTEQKTEFDADFETGDGQTASDYICFITYYNATTTA